MALVGCGSHRIGRQALPFRSVNTFRRIRVIGLGFLADSDEAEFAEEVKREQLGEDERCRRCGTAHGQDEDGLVRE